MWVVGRFGRRVRVCWRGVGSALVRVERLSFDVCLRINGIEVFICLSIYDDTLKSVSYGSTCSFLIDRSDAIQEVS